jgi:hypothetical protein
VGTVDVTLDGTITYTAPARVDELPTAGTLQATVRADGEVLVALKTVLIAPLSLANPEITAFTLDGTALTDEEPLALSTGQAATVEIATEPPIGEDTTFAWYSTSGAIERYQSNPAELIARDEPGVGWLIAVVRDGQLGVAWRVVNARIE